MMVRFWGIIVLRLSFYLTIRQSDNGEEFVRLVVAVN
jgi:hypothetical protein